MVCVETMHGACTPPQIPLLSPIHPAAPSGGPRNTAATTKAFQCEECPRSYSSKYALVRHARQHTNSHLRACVFCGRTSTRADIIRVHMMNCVKKYVKAPSPAEKEVVVAPVAGLQDPTQYLLAITKLMEEQAAAGSSSSAEQVQGDS
eukprot:sb/3473739/